MNKIKNLIMLLLISYSIGFSQGVVNSEKLLSQDVEKFYFIFSPSLDMQSGNSDVLEVSITLSSLYKITEKHWIKGTGGVDMIQEDQEDISNDKFFQLRHTYTLNDWSHTFSFFQLQNSYALGVKKRQLLGAGVRVKLKKEENLKFDIGVGIMNEKEEYNHDISIANKYRITSMMIFKHSFNTVVLKNVTYYQPNISNVWDFRLLNEFDLTFEINNWLDYEVNYIVRYDNEHPSFLTEKLDQYITSGFNIKFNK